MQVLPGQERPCGLVSDDFLGGPVVSKKKAAKKVNKKPITQKCCGAPKNGHYGTCKKGGKK